MDYENWSEQDLEDLDAKFDALAEHLGVEFIFERISDGSDAADRERVYVRAKPQPPLNAALTQAPKNVLEPRPDPVLEPLAEPWNLKKKKYKNY